MARITVEDCLPNVENIFQLVLLAAARARRLANGAEPTVPWENDKPTVVALREIAEGNITPEMLREPHCGIRPQRKTRHCKSIDILRTQSGTLGQFMQRAP